MKTLKLAAIALIASAVPGVVFAAGDSADMAGAPIAAMATATSTMPGIKPGPMPRPMPQAGGRNWGGRHQGRWVGGWRAPGGWGAYRRPTIGYVLPSYWMTPSFGINNWGQYGFSRPGMGYGWSRYYDDAVLTDRYGRVIDSVSGYNWDQYDRYDDGQVYGYPGAGGGYPAAGGGYPAPAYDYPPVRSGGRDRDGGLGGAVIGGAMGAIGGSVIGGRGDRAEGAILGGVIGAVAGAAIDSGDRYGRGYPSYGRPSGMSKKDWKRWQKAQRRGYPGYGYGGAGYGYGYGGGCPPTQTYTLDSNGNAHWANGGGAATIAVPNVPGCVTTVTVNQPQPITTTTTRVVEQVVYAKAAPRKRVHYRAAPCKPRAVRRARPRTQCDVVQGS